MISVLSRQVSVGIICDLLFLSLYLVDSFPVVVITLPPSMNVDVRPRIRRLTKGITPHPGVTDGGYDREEVIGLKTGHLSQV